MCRKNILKSIQSGLYVYKLLKNLNLSEQKLCIYILYKCLSYLAINHKFIMTVRLLSDSMSYICYEQFWVKFIMICSLLKKNY